MRESVPAIIIGCGFGGIAISVALQKMGIAEFRILERAADVGGVWRDNCYPGAACDLVSRLYSLSFEQGYRWSEAFAPRDEILDYIHKVVEKHDLLRRITFGAEVTSAVFDADTATWHVETRSGLGFATPILISAVGIFNRPALPAIPGRETFAGTQFHSARWDRSFQPEGKTVAVIGTGASAVQIVPQIAPRARRLLLFQRSAQYVMPKSVFPGTSEFDLRLGDNPLLRPLARLKIYLQLERFFFRRQNTEARLKGEAAFRGMLEAKVRDPVLRAKLMPDHPLGCKRLLASDLWYDALLRPNVEVIDAPIDSISAGGLYTRDGQFRPADAIVYATGFTPTDFLQPMRITGLDGRELNEAWRDGAEAYLGITVSGFPNFFMLYGPNTNGGGIIFMLECQARYIASCLRALRRRKARYMDVRPETYRAFSEELRGRLERTVWMRSDCNTYVKTAGGRVTTNWPGLSSEYGWRTRKVKPAEYRWQP